MRYTFIGFAKLPEYDPAWKAKCLSCDSSEIVNSKRGFKYEGVEVIRCKRQDREFGSASAARLTDGICGPEARLWQAKEA